MRSKNRIKPFLKELERCWTKVPDLRFLQLLNNILAVADTEEDTFYIEDEDFFKMIKHYEE